MYNPKLREHAVFNHRKNFPSSLLQFCINNILDTLDLSKTMPSEELKLLGLRASPFTCRAMIAFNIKSVGYEFIEENLRSKSDRLLKSNPVYKKVPVLIHGGRPICESPVIVQYIDEVWASGPAILPSDPYARAMARFWTACIDDKLFPGLKAILIADRDEAKKAAAIEEVTQILVLFEDAFTKISKGQKFFGGDKIGYLDISLGCFLVWIRVIEKWDNIGLITESKTPNLFKWAPQFCADVAVKDVLPETDELMEFAKVIFKLVK